jgi:hypothetical protein
VQPDFAHGREQGVNLSHRPLLLMAAGSLAFCDGGWERISCAEAASWSRILALVSFEVDISLSCDAAGN